MFICPQVVVAVQPDMVISTREESLADEDNFNIEIVKSEEQFIDDKETEKSISSDSESVNFSDKDFHLSESEAEELEEEKPKKKVTQEKPFSCKDCDKSYARPNYLAQHVKYCHSNNELIACKVEGCGKEFKLLPSYQVHMKLKHSDKKTKEKDEEEAESTSKYFCCEKCPLRFRLKDRFESHLKFHEGIKPFACQKCNKSYNKLSHLKQHEKHYHSENKPDCFACTYEGCDKKFEFLPSLDGHIRTKHLGRAEDKIHICEECGKSFRNITYLKEHKLTHLGESFYPYQCDQCKKKFKNKKGLNEHVLRHSGVKNFECPHCGMKKATNRELKEHINFHTREREYKCLHCPMIFAGPSSLSIHTNTIHLKIKKYECQYCKQTFAKHGTWKDHERLHTGEKPFACTICGKCFAQNSARRKHEKIHNKK